MSLGSFRSSELADGLTTSLQHRDGLPSCSEDPDGFTPSIGSEVERCTILDRMLQRRFSIPMSGSGMGFHVFWKMYESLELPASRRVTGPDKTARVDGHPALLIAHATAQISRSRTV